MICMLVVLLLAALGWDWVFVLVFFYCYGSTKSYGRYSMHGFAKIASVLEKGSANDAQNS